MFKTNEHYNYYLTDEKETKTSIYLFKTLNFLNAIFFLKYILLITLIEYSQVLYIIGPEPTYRLARSHILKSTTIALLWWWTNRNIDNSLEILSVCTLTLICQKCSRKLKIQKLKLPIILYMLFNILKHILLTHSPPPHTTIKACVVIK